MIFQDFYDVAKRHKDEHVENKKKCGGEPYKSFEQLFGFVKNFSENSKGKSLHILEIGTAVGFTTFVLQQATNIGKIETIEFHEIHAKIAKENILQFGGDISKINFLVGEAENILPTLKENFYDIIFFDGYGAKYFFYTQFEKLLKNNGILITANKFLKSTEEKYFKELQNKDRWEFLESFADTEIYKKIK